jgi:hypothetical protein
MDHKLDASKKLLLRAAQRIRSCLYQAQIDFADVSLPDHTWNECQAIFGRIRLARGRGWHDAAAALNWHLSLHLAQCLEQLKEVYRRTNSDRPSVAIASVRDIFADLSALVDEFEDVAIVLSDTLVAVTTAPVLLEGTALGRFQVRLYCERIGMAHPFDVVALAPNPAHSSQDTTHPHVVDERLCEGDGKLPIARALREGRLFDFFQIVNRLLNTYNASSAYVSLSEWNGSACVDCGLVILPDDERTCYGCEGVLCESCALTCGRCDAGCCSECSRRCGSCGEELCRGCAQECEDCRRPFCEPCLSQCDLCPDCQEKDHAQSIPVAEAPHLQTAAAPAPDSLPEN